MSTRGCTCLSLFSCFIFSQELLRQGLNTRCLAFVLTGRTGSLRLKVGAPTSALVDRKWEQLPRSMNDTMWYRVGSTIRATTSTFEARASTFG